MSAELPGCPAGRFVCEERSRWCPTELPRRPVSGVAPARRPREVACPPEQHTAWLLQVLQGSPDCPSALGQPDAATSRAFLSRRTPGWVPSASLKSQLPPGTFSNENTYKTLPLRQRKQVAQKGDPWEAGGRRRVSPAGSPAGSSFGTQDTALRVDPRTCDKPVPTGEPVASGTAPVAGHPSSAVAYWTPWKGYRSWPRGPPSWTLREEDSGPSLPAATVPLWAASPPKGEGNAGGSRVKGAEHR